MITVLAHPRVLSPESADEGLTIGDVVGVDLDQALARQWPTDAHLTAYAPVEITTEDGGTIPIRVTSGALEAGLSARMVALIGDLDDPIAHATHTPARAAWRAEVEPRLAKTGFRWYRTRGGARLIAELDEPITIASKADAAAWSARYRAWCDAMQAEHGLDLDRQCADWTRLFRLPDVIRDGKRTHEPVKGTRARAILPEATAPAPIDRAAPDPDWTVDPTRLAAMHAIVATLGDPHDLQGKRWALCGALGGLLRRYGWRQEDCDTLIRCWLPEGDPAIDVEAGAKWACGAWAKPAADVSGSGVIEDLIGASAAAAIQAACELPMAARRIARQQAAPDVDTFTPAEAPAVDDPWSACADFNAPPEPVPYLCKGLCLAPSTGKISLIAGQPGVGKGPLADHLAVCFALGLPVFGRVPIERSRVMLADFEGARLTVRRIRRFATAARHAPGELTDWLRVVDCSGMLDPTDDEIQAQLAAAIERYGIGVLILDSYTTAMVATGIEANSPAYAVLGRLLARLGVLVIAVAHSSKAADETRTPRLADVAHTGALAALAQTAIMVQRGETEQAIRVVCARAPEQRFDPIDLEFRDTEDDGLTLEPATAKPKAEASKAKPAERGALTRAMHVVTAGKRMAARLHGIEGHYTRTELIACGGEGPSVGQAALAKLVDRGIAEIVAGRYVLTAEGRGADDQAIAVALGRVGPITRP